MRLRDGFAEVLDGAENVIVNGRRHHGRGGGSCRRIQPLDDGELALEFGNLEIPRAQLRITLLAQLPLFVESGQLNHLLFAGLGRGRFGSAIAFDASIIGRRQRAGIAGDDGFAAAAEERLLFRRE
ncbi:hypothetical protein ONR75_15850 [Rhodopseudomonas sp. P2A-2r]|uniref:hypothetical protein n=1 Tax=Rhodopseudomonas sp. P2A-2r TaxID=2991972 RepID=UPI002234CE0B|nr:hypothetical protein [Rhodopseudomonas sp. P2A-2r]UZE51904.1 hypothetical protein ONR75_15850 [Rhodopseudomonas sp. P2A-2r]